MGRKKYARFDELFDHDYFYDEKGKQFSASTKTIDEIKNIPDYIEQCKQHIKNSRVDLTEKNQDDLIDYNAPFIETPDGKEFSDSSHYKLGILMIHGVISSPCTMRDLTARFTKQGALVFVPSMPGCGTVAENQAKTSHESFSNIVRQSIQQLAKHVDKIIIVGESFGGMLAVLEAQSSSKIKGLVLITPALKVPFTAACVFRLRQFAMRKLLRKKYSLKTSFIHPARYISFLYHIDYQVYLLSKKLVKQNEVLKKMPICMVTGDEDEYLNTAYLKKLINKNDSEHSRMLIYKKDMQYMHHDNKFTTRTSTNEELGVLESSHLCLFSSPDNKIYGINTKFPSLTHYNFKISERDSKKPRRYGSVSKESMKKYLITRLTFNHDFEYMVNYISDFIDNIV